MFAIAERRRKNEINVVGFEFFIPPAGLIPGARLWPVLLAGFFQFSTRRKA
jgi:hypothetical protein